jgi:hypothetical protein
MKFVRRKGRAIDSPFLLPEKTGQGIESTRCVVQALKPPRQNPFFPEIGKSGIAEDRYDDQEDLIRFREAMRNRIKISFEEREFL